ncbi:hypothetical protein GOEFS_035_00490 [Gordonia effusa NBRC 100432]|uniref:Uncharacterized protein n=1 Tax=Gordonia effusa NBRC 100432 TaxID=1077974 RepID=H0QXG6_9ACTN|nr:hypothetical protein [Gordonia effusa]GAB17517.1 hypothetical protein GOEFS_035_00490 [Gordonia effusa NBRC 100432]
MVSVSVREWKTMVNEAIDILGQPWEAVGSGRNLILTPGGCDGWWMSYIYLSPSSIGELIAYNAFLGRAMQAKHTGDRGADARDLQFDGPRRRASEWLNPEALAIFAQAANDQLFATNPTPAEWLAAAEESHAFWLAADDRSMYERMFGPGKQRLVALRVICQSRSREELVADVEWVLADKHIRDYPPISTRVGEGPRVVDFFTELRDLLVADDRSGVEELILRTRAESLAIMSIRNTGNPEFPKGASL